jgi:hypothetical protein
MTPVDGPTYRAVLKVLNDAVTQGTDPIEALNKAGFLLTPRERRRIHVAALDTVYGQLTQWRPAELLRTKFIASHQASPADMYHCVVEWLERYITHWKEEK